MDIRDGFIGAIGNTPLIKLKKASELTGCTILGKAEFLNPGGSVKDRAALFIIEDAERKGELRKGGLIVEGTAGNTGIGLALVGNARGYKTLIVIPDTQSQEKKDMLRLAGADLKEVPAVPYKDPNNYVKVSGRLAEELSMAELRKQTTGLIVFTFDEPPPPGAMDGLPGVIAASASGNEVSVRVDGPVAAVLTRAGELGAREVRTERRDLDDVFLELFQADYDG